MPLTPAPAPPGADPPAESPSRAARALAHGRRLRLWWQDRHLPVRIFDGPPLRVIVIGPPDNLAHLLKAIFGRVPESPAPTEWVHASDLAERAQAFTQRGELVVVTAATDRLPASLSSAWIEIPNLVEQYLPLPATEAELLGSVHNSRTVAELNKIEARGLHAEIVHDAPAWRIFYHRFYAPYVRLRHGDYAWVMPESELMEQRARGAELLLVRDAEGPIAGGINVRHGSSYVLWALGVRDADPALLQQGAVGAHYYFSMRQAIRLGCRYVSLGRSVPLLNDGILFFKKKWGSHLRIDREPARRVLMASGCPHPALPAALHQMPLITCASAAARAMGIEGLVVLDAAWHPTDKELRSWLSRLAYDGLDHMNVALVGHWIDRAAQVMAVAGLPCPVRPFVWDPATQTLQTALQACTATTARVNPALPPVLTQAKAVHF